MRKVRRELSEAQLGYMLCLPAMLLIIGLGIYPVCSTITLSFQDMNIMSGEKTWVGLKYYLTLFADKKFWSAISVTLYFSVISISFQIILGLAIAFLLNKKFRGRTIVRAIVLIPWTLPTIVNATLWGWILDANYGALNRLLLNWGWIDKPVIWLGDARLALHAIILADTWRMLPLSVLMLLAALQTIPNDIVDAAKIDGAGLRNRLNHIYLPLLKRKRSIIYT